MTLQQLPPSARSYTAAQRLEALAALTAVRQVWARVDEADITASFEAVAPTITAITGLAQTRMASQVDSYVASVLAEQGVTRDPAGVFAPRSLVGVTGDGRTVAGLVDQARVQALSLIGGTRIVSGRTMRIEPVTPSAALEASGKWLGTALGTVLSDTARQGEAVASVSRNVHHYVRMLVPPSCSRCAVQAGKVFRRQTQFRRHPGCDCRTVPAVEAVASDMTVDPDAYFRSLDPAMQDRIFTKAGADVIRAGADLGQVVNARRGMTTAQARGADVAVTLEGVTKRGYAYSQMTKSELMRERAKTPGSRYERLTAARLMPETIIAQAGSDQKFMLDALRLYGYLV